MRARMKGREKKEVFANQIHLFLAPFWMDAFFSSHERNDLLEAF